MKTLEEVEERINSYYQVGILTKGMTQEERESWVGPEIFELRERLQKEDKARRWVLHQERLAKMEAETRAEVESIDPSLSYRQLVMLGVRPAAVAKVKTASLRTIETNMRLARRQLEAEGWTFKTGEGRCAVPPPVCKPVVPSVKSKPSGDELTYKARGVSEALHKQYISELADAQRRSNWGSRIRPGHTVRK